MPLDAALQARLLAEVDSLCDDALRTLAVAYRPLLPHADPLHPKAASPLEQGLIFVGTVGIMDPPEKKPGWPSPGRRAPASA